VSWAYWRVEAAKQQGQFIWHAHALSNFLAKDYSKVGDEDSRN